MSAPRIEQPDGLYYVVFDDNQEWIMKVIDGELLWPRMFGENIDHLKGHKPVKFTRVPAEFTS